MKRPQLWFRFFTRNGERWSVYLTLHRLTKALQKDKLGGPYVGRALITRRVIYVDVSDRDLQVILETTLHELGHVALLSLDLPVKLDEDVVESFSSNLWPILASMPVNLPPLPKCVQKYLEAA